MIVYGAMTETSIGRLFAAGIIPGILLAGAFHDLDPGLHPCTTKRWRHQGTGPATRRASPVAD